MTASLLVLTLVCSAKAQTLVDGDSMWVFDGEFNDFVAGPGPDQLHQHLWFWRITGDTQENEFDFATAPFTMVSQRQSEHAFSGPNFSATIQTTLSDSDTPGEAFLTQFLRLTNTSTSTVQVDAFSYTDFDIDGPSGDELEWITPGSYSIVFDSVTGSLASTDAPAVTRSEVAEVPVTLTRLRDDFVDDLDDTAPAPGTSGNISVAFQWTRTLAPGQEGQFLVIYWIDSELTGSPPFRRGDVNDDDTIDISDVVQELAALFDPTAPPLNCADAADVNDDGVVDISDPIFLLGHLFAAGSPIPEPSPACGADPTDDPLDCTLFTGC